MYPEITVASQAACCLWLPPPLRTADCGPRPDVFRGNRSKPSRLLPLTTSGSADRGPRTADRGRRKSADNHPMRHFPLRMILAGVAIGALAAGTTGAVAPRAAALPTVDVQRVPHAGLQPEIAIGRDGVIHLVYFTGTPAAGDLFYVSSGDGGRSFSGPLRVNSQPGSAIATGTI